MPYSSQVCYQFHQVLAPPGGGSSIMFAAPVQEEKPQAQVPDIHQQNDKENLKIIAQWSFTWGPGSSDLNILFQTKDARNSSHHKEGV